MVGKKHKEMKYKSNEKKEIRISETSHRSIEAKRESEQVL